MRVSTSTKLIALGVALAFFNKLQHSTFVTPPRHAVSPLAAATAAATLGAAPSFADPIGDAAKELASAAYPFLKDVDWSSGQVSKLALTNPGDADAIAWARAIAKAIDMGASMDPALLKQGVDAHHIAIMSALKDAKGVTSQEDFEKICASLGRMIASVPENKVMDVYDAFGKLVSPNVPSYLMSTVKADDAQAAYAALMKFKDVVKASPMSVSMLQSPTAVTPVEATRIEAAADRVSAASYFFLKDVDWKSDLPLKVSGYSSDWKQLIKAVDKALVMGAAMDPVSLQEAAKAHVKAIGNMDEKAVARQEDYREIVAGLGKAIASVPEKNVMDVYSAFKNIVNAGVPKYLMATVNADDAKLAYASLMQFKDVVKNAM